MTAEPKEHRVTYRLAHGGLTAVGNRQYFTEHDLAALASQLDDLIGTGRVIKDGRASTVAVTNWNGTEVVIKRYNHRGVLYAVKQSLRTSRARRCWRNAFFLLSLGVLTPAPVAFVEQRRFGLLWQAWLMTEFVDACNLYAYMRDDTVPEEKKRAVAGAVEELLATLYENKIRHGDLKHTNILVTEDGPVLTDLDAMSVHQSRTAFDRLWRKDIGRFQRDADPRFFRESTRTS